MSVIIWKNELLPYIKFGKLNNKNHLTISSDEVRITIPARGGCEYYLNLTVGDLETLLDAVKESIKESI